METWRIAICSEDHPGAHVGGQGVYAFELGRALVALGHEVTFFSPRPGMMAQNPLRFALELRGQASLRSHDILHGNGVAHYLIANNIPTVTTIHNSYPQRISVTRGPKRLAQRGLQVLERRTCRASGHVIAVAPHTARSISHYFDNPSQMSVIPNGVDLERFYPTMRMHQNEPPRVLFVGRLVTRKNLDRFLMAIDLVRTKRNLAVTVVGRGPTSSLLTGRSDVTWVPWVETDQLPQLYQGHDTFVLPSVGEGMPLTLLEALACGTPIVATDDAAQGFEGLADSGCARIVSDEANPRDLAAAIESLLDAGTRVSRESARHYANRYSWAETARKTVSVYRQIG